MRSYAAVSPLRAPGGGVVLDRLVVPGRARRALERRAGPEGRDQLAADVDHARIAVLTVLGQAELEDAVQLPQLRSIPLDVERSLKDAGDHRRRRGGLEGMPADEGFGHQHADREDVAALVGGLARELLGGHVAERAEDRARQREALGVRRLAEA